MAEHIPGTFVRGPFHLGKIILRGNQNIVDVADGIKMQRVKMRGFPDDTHIQKTVFQCRNGFRGGLAENGEFYLRMGFDKILQIGKQKIPAEGGADADGKRACTAFLPAFNGIFPLLDGMKSSIKLL